MTLITEYSLWFALLCVLLGAVFSVALYFRNNNTDFDRKAKIVMSVLRGVSIALIAFLLLAPMLKLNVKETEQPVLIVAIDNSESMVATPDSAFYRADFQEEINNLVQSFSDKYDVKTYLLGESATATNSKEQLAVPFDGKMTNLSSLFTDVENVYANQNVGAMVLVSDGIYNTGSNPQYQAERLKFPVYTVLAGDTTVQTDLRIAGIIHNSQTFLGNYFPVEIKVAATHLAGNKAVLKVLEGENEVFNKTIDIRGNQHFETVKLTLNAKTKGTQKYRVELTELDGEVTYRNNADNFYIQVVDTREKIAIVYYAPHPDVGAIKAALETSDKYEVEVFAAENFNKNPNDYSLFILHQLPAVKPAAGNLLSKIQQEGISALYVIGKQSDLKAFNNLGAGISITQQGGKVMYNEAYPSFNDNFLTFTFSEEARQMLRNYTPLLTYFANYQTSVGANVFMYQKISNVVSTYPLILFSQNAKGRTGVITGTDIWRWRLQNYLKAQNFDAFDEIINKIALYMSVKGDKSYFRVHSQEVYNENTPVEFTAEVYNESYELITDPDVRFVLTDGNGKEYVSQFSKQNSSYYLNLGKLPVGDYSWEASTVAGTKTYKKSGSFSVQEILLESMNLVANRDVMRAIAENTNGQCFDVRDMENLEKVIKENDDIKPVVTYNKKYTLILNSWIYLALIILLLGIEWFMRKWGGGY
ncbi:MAG: hypothetical protein J6Y35_02095 [Bacteroidales bacterium]|nr:hypothetical protein [Bacteroidales bacterium]